MEELLNIIQKVGTSYRKLDLYNTRLSHISFDVSLLSASIQVAMAKTLDPNISMPIKPGQQVYSQKRVFFSLSPLECTEIARDLPLLLSGKYENTDPKSTIKDSIVKTHYKNSLPSRFIIGRHKTKDNVYTGSLVITIIPCKGEGDSCSFVLRNEEVNLVANFIKHGSTTLPFFSCMFGAVFKAMTNIKYNLKNNTDGNSKPINKKSEPAGELDSAAKLDGISLFDDDSPNENQSGGDDSDISNSVFGF